MDNKKKKLIVKIAVIALAAAIVILAAVIVFRSVIPLTRMYNELEVQTEAAVTQADLAEIRSKIPRTKDQDP